MSSVLKVVERLVVARWQSWRFHDSHHWLGAEIVEGQEAADDGGEDGGDAGVGGVGDVGFAVNVIVMNLGVEGSGDLGGGAAEFEHEAVVGDGPEGESLGLEPGLDGLDVRVGDAELASELVGREPVVVLGRRLVLNVDEELVEGLLLLVAGLKKKDDALEGQAGIDGALVEGGPG